MSLLTNVMDNVAKRLGFIRASQQVVRLLSTPWERDYGVVPPATLDDYLDQYGEAAWVYVCAKIKAQKCASAEFALFIEKDNGEKEDVKKHVFLDVLRRPNDMMSELHLKILKFLHLELCGEAFWYIPKNLVGGPAQILPLMPNFMTVIPGTDRLVQGYVYRVNGEEVPFEADEIVHFYYPNPDPDSFFRGASHIKPAEYAIATNQNSEIWNYKLFKNGAIPAGYLRTEKRLEEPEVERLRLLWERHHKGESNWRKVAIAQQGLEYKEEGMSHKDMDFVNQMNMTRDTQLAIFGMSKSIAGLTDDVTMANSAQVERNFMKHTIAPILDLDAATLNAFVLPRFDERLRCEYRNVVPSDEEFNLKKKAAMVDRKAITINEWRAEEGLEPVAWGDEPYNPYADMLSGNGLPGEKPSNDDQGEGAGENDEGDDTGRRPGDDEDENDEADNGARALHRKGLLVRKAAARARVKALWGTKDGRDREWASYVRRLTKRETRFKAPLRKWFQQLQDNVNKRLREIYGERALAGVTIKADADELAYNILEEARKLQLVTQPLISSSVSSEAQYLIDQLELDFTFDPAQSQVIAWARTRAGRFSFYVSNSTAQALRGTLDEGIRAGETLAQLTERVNTLFKDKKGWEAERIARTEVSTASSFGRQAAYMQSDVVDGKEWLSADDERTRDSHLSENMKARIVKKGEMFVLGSGVATMGPGLSGVAEEDINCRCVSIPVISDLEE